MKRCLHRAVRNAGDSGGRNVARSLVAVLGNRNIHSNIYKLQTSLQDFQFSNFASLYLFIP